MASKNIQLVDVETGEDKFYPTTRVECIIDIDDKLEGYQKKLPTGEDGEILTKTSDGVEWKPNNNKWTYV